MTLTAEQEAQLAVDGFADHVRVIAAKLDRLAHDVRQVGKVRRQTSNSYTAAAADIVELVQTRLTGDRYCLIMQAAEADETCVAVEAAGLPVPEAQAPQGVAVAGHVPVEGEVRRIAAAGLMAWNPDEYADFEADDVAGVVLKALAAAGCVVVQP